MNDRPDSDADTTRLANTTASRQIPHVPGHDPQGSGLPRQREVLTAPSAPRSSAEAEGSKAASDARSAPASDAHSDANSGRPGAASRTPNGNDAPLGGSEITEEQLTADTAVERDAVKALDPDDAPA